MLPSGWRGSVDAIAILVTLATTAIAVEAGGDASQVSKAAFSWAPQQLVESEVCKVCEALPTNWGGNFHSTAGRIVYPRSTEEVAHLVRSCPGQMRAVGSRHSFNGITHTSGTLVSLSLMTGILGVAPDLSNITVQAGIKYTDLVPYLEYIGRALPNLAALGEISVAGAISTAVHGSGVNNRNLAAQVIGIRMVIANGSILALTDADNSQLLKTARVGLGSLGIITEVTLATVPSFQAQTFVFENLPTSELVDNFDTIIRDAYSVQMFTNFADPEMIMQVWLTSKLGDAHYKDYLTVRTYHNATAATAQVTILAEAARFPPTCMIPQLGAVVPWYLGITIYRLGLSGFNGAQLQSEYFVAASKAPAAILALKPLASRIHPLAYVSSVRTVAPDNAHMSMVNGDNVNGELSATLHFTWKPDTAAVTKLLPDIERALAPYDPLPHWGKYHTMEPCTTFLKRYKHLHEFRAVAEELDPRGKFRNKFVDANLFAKCT